MNEFSAGMLIVLGFAAIPFAGCGDASDDAGDGPTDSEAGSESAAENTTRADSASGSDGGAEASTGNGSDTAGGATECALSRPTETCEPEDTQVQPGECSTFRQDCPSGQKCIPVLENAETRCVDVPADPIAVEGFCTWDPAAASDPCEPGAVCWNPDRNDHGICRPLCGCSADTPACDDDKICFLANRKSIAVCQKLCDPLAPKCEVNEGCYLEDGAFQCVRDGSIPTSEGPGVVCDWFNACSPGLHCAPASSLPSCDGNNCCTEFCDMRAPQCPQGKTCQSPYLFAEPQTCWEHVGACLAPQ